LFHGTQDTNIPHEAVKDFVTSMKLLGNEAKLVSFESMEHFLKQMMILEELATVVSSSLFC
jgi:dipeptidyl aminopeptidase/acylaminoacyl peptidase